MTRTMGTRRAALLAGAAAAAVAALSACGAGQIAETALKDASVYAASAESADGSLLIRGLAVAYGSPEGYPAGANVPLEVHLFNQTTRPITVTVSSAPSATQAEGVLSARSVNLIGPVPTSTATAPSGDLEPSGSRPPAVPLPEDSAAPTSMPSAVASVGAGVPSAGQPAPTSGGVPARFTIEPLGTVDFRPGDSPSLQLVGLSGPLRPGNSVNLIFEFGSGQPLVVAAPVASPLSPAPRGSIKLNEGIGEGDHG